MCQKRHTYKSVCHQQIDVTHISLFELNFSFKMNMNQYQHGNYEIYLFIDYV